MIAQTVAHGEGHPVAIAMPVPTSNQGAEPKRWLVPLLATSAARDGVGSPHVAAVVSGGVPRFRECREGGTGRGRAGPILQILDAGLDPRHRADLSCADRR